MYRGTWKKNYPKKRKHKNCLIRISLHYMYCWHVTNGMQRVWEIGGRFELFSAINRLYTKSVLTEITHPRHPKIQRLSYIYLKIFCRKTLRGRYKLKGIEWTRSGYCFVLCATDRQNTIIFLWRLKNTTRRKKLYPPLWFHLYYLHIYIYICTCTTWLITLLNKGQKPILSVTSAVYNII